MYRMGSYEAVYFTRGSPEGIHKCSTWTVKRISSNNEIICNTHYFQKIAVPTNQKEVDYRVLPGP